MADFTAYFKEILPNEFPSDLLDKISQDWEDILLAKRTKIHERIKDVIPDADAYKSRLCEPAIEGFANVLNPDFYKYNRAIMKYKIKIVRGANAYINNIQAAFSEGGNFEEGVKANKEKYKSNVTYTIRFTGDKNKIFGCVPKMALACQGKHAILSKVLIEADYMSGTPMVMFKYDHLARVVAALTNVAIEGLILARMCLEGGEDVKSVLDYYNRIIEQYIRIYDEATGTYNPSPFLSDKLDPNGTWIKLGYDQSADRLYINVAQTKKAT